MRSFFLIFCVLCVLCGSGFSQIEPSREMHNLVLLTARHCSNYVLPDGSVDTKACQSDPSTIYFQQNTHNLRTNGGADWWANQTVGGSSTTAAATQARYLGLSADTTSPAGTDSSCPSELTGGLARAQATATHTTGTSQTVLTYTWTYGATGSQTIAKVCAFNATSNGTMVLEALISPSATVSAATDQFTVSYTINF